MTINPSPENPTSDSPTTDERLDAGTFSRIIEPRGENRLPLGDGTWHQVSPKYVTVELISNLLWVAICVIVGVAVQVFASWPWIWLIVGPLSIVQLITLALLPRQARAIGYQLRADDFVFRRGIIFQRMVAVPYGRLQLVDISQGPLERGFDIATLKLITAAATTGVELPGLDKEAAEYLRDRLIDVAETRRTGL